MPYPARFVFGCLLSFATLLLHAQQPLVRTPASTLQLPAAPPATSYSTARAFPALSFNQPVALVTPPGETRRLFVVEKPGRIWVVPDVTAATPTRLLFLDLTDRVTVSSSFNDERGLLALAFHPDHATNGQFFVWYTTTASTAAGSGLHNRLSRFHVSATDANAANPGSEQPLITQRDEAGNHNGGELLFGSDGYLYLSVGDEGGGNDPFQNSQRIDRDFFAGILRIDVDRRPGSLPPNPHPAVHPDAYAVPPDNPFVGATSFNGVSIPAGAVRTEFWATGLRNPWRMAFDPSGGRLWCADVGQDAREEINVIVRGGNYGWSYREGNIPGPRPNPPAAASLIEPIWTYGRSDGSSVTGGIVYRGPKHPLLHGRYLFADFASGRLWALNPDGENPVSSDRVQLLATDSGVASFGLDPSNGDILLADLLEGAIKRLVATTTSGGVPFPATLSATGAFADLATLAPATGLVAYEPNVSFWSDHAQKRRWFALPDATSQFSLGADGRWTHPAGAVWVKHFDLELTRGDPSSARRIETRFLVKTESGAYGLTYRWNEAQTEATLVPDEGADENFTIVENGIARTQTWRFPSRTECLTCHTDAGGHALSFNSRQLNRDYAFPGGTTNIIDALVQAGYLNAPSGIAPATLPALARADDTGPSIEHRARSYLDVNCSHCHQPGGTALGSWDARATTPLSLANLINGPLVDNGGDPANRMIVPGDPAHSRALQRMSVRSLPAAGSAGQMPPIATNERDLAGESLLREWIAALAEPPPPPPPPPPSGASRIINLAARGPVDASGNVVIAGFVIGPGASKNILVRAVGPTLAAAPFDLAGTLANPAVTVFGPNSATRIAADNDDWQAADASVFSSVGAFPLVAGSRDAALVARLEPGAYTAVVNATNGTGIALAEIYDLEPTSGARLINLALRAHVGTGDNILIAGVVVSGGESKTVLVRAVGPGLAQFDVDAVLAAPSVALLSGGQILFSNTRWGTAANAAQISATAAQVGAFALADADSAILATLAPGNYTIQVSGVNNTTGAALVEVYDVQ